MAINDSFADANTGLADATDWVIDGSSSGTGAVRITEFAGTSDAEIYREQDPDGDGTWEYRQKVDSLTGQWHSQDNSLRVSTNANIRLVIRNTSGAANDFMVSGYEVDN